jgi:colanic acid/amylovoran biosynthesis glycosyltransferase
LPEEINYTHLYFEKIILIPTVKKSTLNKNFPSNVIIDNSFSDMVKSKFLVVKFLFLALKSRKVYQEVSNFYFTPYSFLRAFLRTVKFEILSEILVVWLNQQSISNSDGKNRTSYVFYSFWFNAVVYGLTKSEVTFKRKIISRAHGYDLFEHRHSPEFFPFRTTYIKNVDLIICSSKDGVNYLQSKYPESASMIRLSYLGVKNRNVIDYAPGNKTGLVLVSCSSITDVKRVEKIALSLSLVKDLIFVWYHIGSGRRSTLLKLIRFFREGKNQKWYFLGQISNESVNEFYEDVKPDLFINLSSSEGLPVSIMEAARAGIPVIATNVGGTKEIIKHRQNGFLIDPNLSNYALSEIYLEIFKDLESLKSYSKQIRSTYDANFRSEHNYSDFINLLKIEKII